MWELANKVLKLMGQAVFIWIQVLCNYSGAKLAMQVPGGTESRLARSPFYKEATRGDMDRQVKCTLYDAPRR